MVKFTFKGSSVVRCTASGEDLVLIPGEVVKMKAATAENRYIKTLQKKLLLIPVEEKAEEVKADKPKDK